MSEYSPNKLLVETVQSGDAYSVRGALVAIILSEPSFSEGTVYKAIEYAEKNGISVYQDHDPSVELNTNTSAWNEKYFARVSNQLGENFSKERLAHLENVGRKISGTSRTAQRTFAPGSRLQTHSAPKKPENFPISRQTVIAAIAVIAVAAAIIVLVRKIILS